MDSLQDLLAGRDPSFLQRHQLGTWLRELAELREALDAYDARKVAANADVAGPAGPGAAPVGKRKAAAGGSGSRKK